MFSETGFIYSLQRRKRRLLLAALASGAALALVLIRQRCVLLRPTKGSV